MEQLMSLIQQQQNQLQQRENQYNQQMLSFQQELQGLRTQANNNNNSSSSSSSSSSNNKSKASLYRAPPPPTFNGEHNNYIATQWLYKVELFFTVAKTEEEDKVNIAALSFDKNAMQWFVHLRNSLKEKH